MISIWFFCWLVHYLSSATDAWYMFPMIITGLASFFFEICAYTRLSLWLSE